MMIKDYQKLDLFRLPSGFRGRPAIVVQLWWIIQSLLFAPSPQFLYGWRRFLLRIFGADIGRQVKIRPSVKITYPWKVKIGNRSWIGDRAELYSLGEISIGNDVVVSQKSYLCAATHDQEKQTFDLVGKKIVIADQSWIAADVFIAPGITVGRGALVGARSSVFTDIPEGMVCYGSPARVIKKRAGM